MQNEQTQSYKDRALAHVRQTCPELMELSFGCEVIGQSPKNKGRHGRISKRDGEYGYTIWSDGTGNILSPIKIANLKIIGHTPHLEHWLRGIRSVRQKPEPRFWHKNTILLDQHVHDDDNELEYQLDLDGENQSEEFYKAYCEIVGI